MQKSQQLGSTSAIGNRNFASMDGKSMLKSASAPVLKASKSPKKTPIGELDHNNFTATSDPSKHDKNTPMIKKSSMPPPIKSFDGEIVVIRKGPPIGKKRPYNFIILSYVHAYLLTCASFSLFVVAYL